MTPEDQGEWVGTVSIPTDLSPAEMLSRVTAQAVAGKMSPGEASDLLFPFLFEGTVHERRRMYAVLRELATPEAILETALRTYRVQGYEGYLNEAVSLLADFRTAGWPAIRKWAQGGGAECESLVDTVVTFRGVQEADRLDALKDLVLNGDQNTRRRILESIHQLPGHTRKQTLLLFRGIGDPTDPTRAEAEELLAEEQP
jgi:hypothetical protein